MRLLLSMGVSPAPGAPLRPELRALDPRTGAVETLLQWTPTVHPPGEHAELTGARWDGDALLVCSRTEVLWLRWPGPTVARVLSHPWMHDVHDALRLPDGRVAVCSTGIDSVLLFDGDRLAGSVVLHPYPQRARPADDDLTRRLSRLGDLRRVATDTFKPHPVHPNHLAWHDGALWVTSLTDRALRPLDRSAAIRLDAPPHDGIRDGDAWWVSTVDGRVHRLGDDGSAAIVDVAAIEGRPGLPGWCRALARVDDLLFVGFSALRHSRWRELGRLAARGRAGRKQPTRVVAVDLRGPRVVASWPVGGPGGGTIYAIVPDHGGVTAPPTAAP